MITAIEIATALRPALIRAPAVGPMKFRHAVVDSRKARKGDLFVALKGENVDGHDFVADAASRGATGAIVEHEIPADIAQYVVPSALIALQELARNRRIARPKLEVVGVTGSVGKTTTKELTAAVLDVSYHVLKNEGNLNSEIGLPLVLLELTKRHNRAVLEMGMWAPGEIALLCEISPISSAWARSRPSSTRRLNSSKRCPMTARRSSTPTTRVSPPWPSARTPTS
jgi:UDP-N-acetylmuramoyl-tripeptide--D-alanyl-D-alanine ligase